MTPAGLVTAKPAECARDLIFGGGASLQRPLSARPRALTSEAVEVSFREAEGQDLHGCHFRRQRAPRPAPSKEHDAFMQATEEIAFTKMRQEWTSPTLTPSACFLIHCLSSQTLDRLERKAAQEFSLYDGAAGCSNEDVNDRRQVRHPPKPPIGYPAPSHTSQRTPLRLPTQTLLVAAIAGDEAAACSVSFGRSCRR